MQIGFEANIATLFLVVRFAFAFGEAKRNDNKVELS